MKKYIFCLIGMYLCSLCPLSAFEPSDLPKQITCEPQGKHHVQGIAFDEAHSCIYFSFTTTLIKTDLEGRLLGSVEGLTGHLGCMALNPEDGRIYASLEYKHDGIGKGIGTQGNDTTDGFYVAIFDGARITRPHMDAKEVMQTVYLREVVNDYAATVYNQGRPVKHRYGCSGVDGLAIAPKWGKHNGKQMLYIAYGIYGDTDRTDNDYQVIHCYDIRNWKRYAQPLTPSNLHQSGPQKPNRKYFVRTGNTSYGIQNLAYDKHTGHLLAAVYPGNKTNWPNYKLFVIDGTQQPRKDTLIGHDNPKREWTLNLWHSGEHDEATDTWGYRSPDATTGLCALGNGYFYVSHHGKEASTGRQFTTLRLYHWDEHGWTLVK